MKINKYRAEISSLIAIGLVLMMSYDITSDSILSTLCGSSDIESSDFYNRVIGGSCDKYIDENIVIVNIDSVIERREIAELVKQIDSYEPQLIAVDVIFEERIDSVGDSFLINTFRNIKNLLIAQTIDPYTIKLKSDLISDSLPRLPRGVINLTKDIEYGIVRTFTPFWDDKKEYLSFPCAIIQMITPEKLNQIKERNNQEETISFSPSDFYVVDPSDIQNAKNIIKGKIVLLGTLTDPSDVHKTPIDENYPGVMLHAQTTLMLIQEKLVNKLSDAINWCLAIILCLTMTHIYVYMDNSNIQNFGTRIIPILWMLIIIWIGCYAFINWHIYLDVPKILLLSALGILVLDFWYALEVLIVHIKSKIVKK